MSRIAQLRKLLTEQLIEELLVKYILNIGETEQKQNRIAYHFRLAYYCFLHKCHLHQLTETLPYAEEENFFMSKLNEYLPDFIRYEAYSISDMQEQCSQIPVYGAIIFRNNKRQFLLVQDRRTGKYGFCKGKISEGETIEDCVKRQVMQEIGLKVKIFGKRTSVFLSNGKQYIFVEAEVEEAYHTHKDLVYEGDNYHHEIKKLVWWSVAKIKYVCRYGLKGPEKLNIPTFLTFKQILY